MTNHWAWLQSMAETDIWLMSLAATFAACKSEDNPRALQDIIYHGLRPERVGVTLKPHRPKLFERTKADEKVTAALMMPSAAASMCVRCHNIT